MNKIKQLLAKPFPQQESILETLRIVAGISVFVVLFLYVFKPFGIHQIESGLFAICFGFGLVTFIASLVYEFIVVRILKFKGEGANFTFGRWILYLCGVMLFISLANFLFVRLALFGDIQWALFPYMVRGVFAVGFFPTIVLGGFALLRQERKYRNIADKFNQKENGPASIEQSNIKHIGDHTIFNIPSDRIRYIEAMQNYIKIGYIDTAGQLQEQTERATLQSISNAAEGNSLGNPIVRCHRSFLVNRESISSISGNAQGLLLCLSDCEKEIPVSRSYVSIFRQP